MNHHTNGMLFFIFPQKVSSVGNSIVKKDLQFDITYLTSKDSATVALTYIADQSIKTDSLKLFLVDGETSYSAATEVLYIERKSSKWVHRVKFAIPYQMLEELFALNSSPLTVIIPSKLGDISYSYSAKKWKKQTELMSNIFEVIQLNK